MYESNYSMNGQFKKTITLTLALSIISVMSFFMLEPNIGQAISTTFNVRQSITAEISFLATTTAVTMVGSIAGITGGTATGTAQTVVQTNSNGGYNMTIQFAGNTGGAALLGDNGTNNGIKNFGTTTTPVLNFAASTSALFGFTITATSTTDIATTFLNNGTVCGVGGSQNPANPSCWMNPTTTAAITIINRTSATLPSSTSTLVFKVVVPNNPSPAVASDFYTATATLTAVAQ